MARSSIALASSAVPNCWALAHVIFDTSINATNPAKMVLFTTFTCEDANDAELLSFYGRQRNDSRHLLERTSDTLGHSHT
jgi:hypothetical protein